MANEGLMGYQGVFEDAVGRRLEVKPVADAEWPYSAVVVLPESLQESLRHHPGYPFEIKRELKAWVEIVDNVAHLVIEGGRLEMPGAGPTLRLKQKDEDTLTPEVEGGLYDDFEDDFGLPWAFPMSVYRRVG